MVFEKHELAITSSVWLRNQSTLKRKVTMRKLEESPNQQVVFHGELSSEEAEHF